MKVSNTTNNKSLIVTGDSLNKLRRIADGYCDCCITSPPYYGLRDYSIDGQVGLEKDPDQYVEKLVEIFREVRRVLKEDGTLWLNVGDSYKNKELLGIPWRLAFALQKDGWNLRQDIIWHKPNAMPESVKDRCTKSHEYIFLFSKSKKYYFDSDAIVETANYDGRKDTFNKGSLKYATEGIVPGKTPQTQAMAGRAHERWRFRNGEAIRNKRDVWVVNTKPCKEAHFATFPEKLIEPCVLAGSPEGGIVLDPFLGSGTTAVVAKKNNRCFIGIDINPNYTEIAKKRINELGATECKE